MTAFSKTAITPFSDHLHAFILLRIIFISLILTKTTSLLSVLLIEINLLFTFRGINLVLNQNHIVPYIFSVHLICSIYCIKFIV